MKKKKKKKEYTSCLGGGGGGGGGLYRAELDASDAVAQLVQRRRPAHDAHHVGHHQQDAAGHARLGREAHLEEAEPSVSNENGGKEDESKPNEQRHSRGRRTVPRSRTCRRSA